MTRPTTPPQDCALLGCPSSNPLLLHAPPSPSSSIAIQFGPLFPLSISSPSTSRISPFLSPLMPTTTTTVVETTASPLISPSRHRRNSAGSFPPCRHRRRRRPPSSRRRSVVSSDRRRRRHSSWREAGAWCPRWESPSPACDAAEDDSPPSSIFFSPKPSAWTRVWPSSTTRSPLSPSPLDFSPILIEVLHPHRAAPMPLFVSASFSSSSSSSSSRGRKYYLLQWVRPRGVPSAEEDEHQHERVPFAGAFWLPSETITMAAERERERCEKGVGGLMAMLTPCVPTSADPLFLYSSSSSPTTSSSTITAAPLEPSVSPFASLSGTRAVTQHFALQKANRFYYSFAPHTTPLFAASFSSSSSSLWCAAHPERHHSRHMTSAWQEYLFIRQSVIEAIVQACVEGELEEEERMAWRRRVQPLGSIPRKHHHELIMRNRSCGEGSGGCEWRGTSEEGEKEEEEEEGEGSESLLFPRPRGSCSRRHAPQVDAEGHENGGNGVMHVKTLGEKCPAHTVPLPYPSTVEEPVPPLLLFRSSSPSLFSSSFSSFPPPSSFVTPVPLPAGYTFLYCGKNLSGVESQTQLFTDVLQYCLSSPVTPPHSFSFPVCAADHHSFSSCVWPSLEKETKEEEEEEQVSGRDDKSGATRNGFAIPAVTSQAPFSPLRPSLFPTLNSPCPMLRICVFRNY